MNVESRDLGKLGELDEDLRLLLAAGLMAISEDMTEAHPMLAAVETVRSALMKDTILSNVPLHISFAERELQEMISYLPHTEYWAIYWEPGDYDTYDLVGEVAVEGSITHFGLATGLRGSDAFVLNTTDAAFATKVRNHVRLWAPATSDELHAGIVEIPVPAVELASTMENGGVLEAHLASITEQFDLSGFMTRATRADIHSNSDLASADYVGVTAVVLDTRKKIDVLPGLLSSYEAGLVASIGHPSAS